MPLPKVLKELLALPTAPFVENAVLAYIERACARLGDVRCTTDRYGNLLAHYRRGTPGRPPLVFSAHTDHPGFVAAEMLDGTTLRAEFRGGVFAEYFARTGVRFWSGGRWTKGRVQEVTKTKEVYRLIGSMRLPEEVLVRVRGAVEPGSAGMWDLSEPTLRGDIVRARGCDDVAGAAALLALLQRLSRRRVNAEVYCLFSRAEEVGFIGAIATSKARTIPKSLPIISIEMSSARGGGAEIGGGPVLRVGDKASIFTPQLTAFCQRVADRLAKGRRRFTYQRKLMAGGTCESTAFLAYGYASTGICLALGNYHNMDVERGKIAAETISLHDWKLMVDWFEALVRDKQGYGEQAAAVRGDLERRFQAWRSQLDALRRSEPRAS